MLCVGPFDFEASQHVSTVAGNLDSALCLPGPQIDDVRRAARVRPKKRDGESGRLDDEGVEASWHGVSADRCALTFSAEEARMRLGTVVQSNATKPIQKHLLCCLVKFLTLPLHVQQWC